MTKIEFAKKWFEKVWHDEDSNAISEMFSPSAKAGGLHDDGMIGPEEFKGFHAALLQLITNIKISIDHSFEKDNDIVVICSLSANRRSDNAPVAIKGTTMMRVEKETIQYAENFWDFISLFEQIGLMPSGVMGACLSGGKLILKN